MYSDLGPINEALRAVNLDGVSWLGSFTFALPAVGLIGTWIMFGLCMVLFIAGVQKIPTELYEAARVDGAGPVREFFAVTLPALRGEIMVALVFTLTIALRNFDIVWNTTMGGPGESTMVPSIYVYEGAFITRDIGQAASISILLTILILAITATVIGVLRERDA
jgi:raffinose/stachyose/melibiose transport system permease protein